MLIAPSLTRLGPQKQHPYFNLCLAIWLIGQSLPAIPCHNAYNHANWLQAAFQNLQAPSAEACISS
jgi:hypothetical protein